MPARPNRSRGLQLVGDDAELEAAVAQAAQHAVDLGPELEDVEVANHGAHALVHALDGLRIAAAQRFDHVGIGIGREGRDRGLRRLVDHRRIDTDALQPAGRGDGAVDRDLPGEFQVEWTTDVEENRAIRHLPSFARHRLQRFDIVGKRIGR
jgi:hypothetical protein